MIDSIIEFEDVVDISPEVWMFADCKFKKDFGPIKQGATYAIVNLSFDKSMLELYLTNEDETPSLILPIRLEYNGYLSNFVC